MIGEVEVELRMITRHLIYCFSFSKCWCQDINQTTSIKSASDMTPSSSQQPQISRGSHPFKLQTSSMESTLFISHENPPFSPSLTLTGSLPALHSVELSLHVHSKDFNPREMFLFQSWREHHLVDLPTWVLPVCDTFPTEGEIRNLQVQR